ncbi:glycosyltransferase family 4 protein [Pleurotus ostreatus PC15]|uniref:GDP-Man:Man(3)GlcNAc(2)-PP-Dol alpha-1,2-mannosyltransferase n=1 Tax=Pleurotus ostreatus (strain PC15) TaxID=1137138 RepID=A0A067NDT8_PLEO1|nr:glycosyltransferase family 4 protein [Pleurotus ostreatus PC15]
MIIFALILVLTVLGALKICGIYLRARKSSQRAGLGSDVSLKRIIGFFHPYCNAGGGGERVLWTAIAAMQHSDPNLLFVVYSGDVDASKEEIIAKAKSRFAITLDPSSLHFVFLKSRVLVESTTWPYFTLLGQSLGSMYVALEAMASLLPDLYIDTMGYAFTFFVVSWLCGVPAGAYVHYPTISTDMLARVRSRKKWHTNQSRVAESSVLSGVKLLYYRLFMYYYAAALRQASFLMVNSSWTKAHVDSILKHSDITIDILHKLVLFPFKLILPAHQSPDNAAIVYPPCDTKELAQFPLEGREHTILSIAQFRPEKDHSMQLQAFAELLREHPQYGSSAKLVLIGGARNDEDEARVGALKEETTKLGLQANVVFVVNAPYPAMLEWLRKCSIGVNTMVDEHFGINVVEYMAAGAIPVAHASGGPLRDIVVPLEGERTGFHATSAAEYASAFDAVFALSEGEEIALRARARRWAVGRFSEDEFVRGWHESGWRRFLATPDA